MRKPNCIRDWVLSRSFGSLSPSRANSFYLISQNSNLPPFKTNQKKKSKTSWDRHTKPTEAEHRADRKQIPASSPKLVSAHFFLMGYGKKQRKQRHYLPSRFHCHLEFALFWHIRSLWFDQIHCSLVWFINWADLGRLWLIYFWMYSPRKANKIMLSGCVLLFCFTATIHLPRSDCVPLVTFPWPPPSAGQWFISRRTQMFCTKKCFHASWYFS